MMGSLRFKKYEKPKVEAISIPISMNDPFWQALFLTSPAGPTIYSVLRSHFGFLLSSLQPVDGYRLGGFLHTNE